MQRLSSGFQMPGCSERRRYRLSRLRAEAERFAAVFFVSSTLTPPPLFSHEDSRARTTCNGPEATPVIGYRSAERIGPHLAVESLCVARVSSALEAAARMFALRDLRQFICPRRSIGPICADESAPQRAGWCGIRAGPRGDRAFGCISRPLSRAARQAFPHSRRGSRRT